MPGEQRQRSHGEETIAAPPMQHSLEQEDSGPTGSDGRETAPDAESAELGEHAYRGEVEQPRRPPADE